MNKIYLFLLTLFAAVGLANAADAPARLDVRGNVAGGGWNQGVELTKSNDGTFFYGQFNFASNQSNCEFRFGGLNADGSYKTQYGATASNDAERKFDSVPENFTMKEEAGDTFFFTGDDRYTNPIYVKVDFSGASPVASFSKTTPFTDDSDLPEVPAKLWLLSEHRGYQDGSPLKMTYESETKSFTAGVTMSPKSGGSLDYFRFSTTGGSEWGSKTFAFGAASDASAASLMGNPNPLYKGNNYNFTVAPGTYNIRVDFSDVSNPVMYIALDDPNPKIGPKLYLRRNGYTMPVPLTETSTSGVYTYISRPTETRAYYFAFHAGAPDYAGALKIDGTDIDTYGGSATSTTAVAWTVGADAKAMVPRATAPIQAYLTSGNTYIVTVDTNPNIWTLKIELQAETVQDTDREYKDNQGADRYYYLSGDINVWSDIAGRNTKNSSASGYGTGDGTFEHESDGNFNYKQDDVDNPYLKFETIESMNTKWRFDKVTDVPYAGAPSGQWYKLDLRAKGAGDRDGNVGRLCGEFKIIGGKLEQTDEGIGVNGNQSDTYFGKVIKPGELFTHGEWNGGQNFLLDNTTIENAVVWFNKDNCNVYVTGRPHDLYVYYAKYEGTNEATGELNANTFTAPESVHLGEVSQQNKYVPRKAYINGTYESGAAYADYEWKKYEPAEGEKIWYRNDPSTGLAFNYVYRKKIPSSFAHAMPMGYLTSVTKSTKKDDGTSKWFPRVRMNCEDIWFLENQVNLYVRYKDEALNENARVYYNAFVDRFNADLTLAGSVYMSDDILPMTDNGKVDGTENMVDIESGEHYGRWHKSPKPMDDLFSNGYAIVATDYGVYLPINDSFASNDEKARMHFDGRDLYVTLGESSGNVSILYDHLNGTFCKGDAQTVQINAEYFITDEDAYNVNEIDFSLGDGVTYEFLIYNEGKLVVKKEADQLPFYDWNVQDLAAGLYTVQVKVHDRTSGDGTDHVSTATDVYVIYPSR